MVYLALYKNKGVVDIEWWLDYYDQEKGKWRSEIKVTPIPDGIAEFCYDTDAKFIIDEFVKDINKLRDLRFQLYEYWGNSSLDLDEARERHNRYTTPVKTHIDAFCKKYNFELDID